MAFAGAAAADVEFSGSANAGLRDVGPGDARFHYELNLTATFSGSTDNGLTFGASFDTEFDSNTGFVNAAGATATATDPEIFISGAFGTLTFGELDPMLDNIGLRDIGFDGIGIDNVFEGRRFASGGGEANMTYMYEGAGFTFGVSAFLDQNSTAATQQEGDFGILLGYEMDGFSASVAFDRNDSVNVTQWGLNLGYAMDAYAVNLAYTDGDNGDAWGLDASYTLDALTIIAAYASDSVTNVDAFGIGASYDLGGGLGIAGGIGEIDGTGTVWDLGLTMDF